MTLQYRAGQPTLWEPCLLHYLYLDQRWDPEPLLADIRRPRFAATLLSPDFADEPLHAALNKRYRKTGVRAGTTAVPLWGNERDAIFVPDWTGGTAFHLYEPVKSGPATMTASAPSGG